MQNANDARNANERIHIYGTKFCLWVISAGGQVYLGAIPVRNVTPCLVILNGEWNKLSALKTKKKELTLNTSTRLLFLSAFGQYAV